MRSSGLQTELALSLEGGAEVRTVVPTSILEELDLVAGDEVDVLVSRTELVGRGSPSRDRTSHLLGDGVFSFHYGVGINAPDGLAHARSPRERSHGCLARLIRALDIRG